MDPAAAVDSLAGGTLAFGKMPPAPDNLRVASSRERRAGSITIRDVVIEFGPGHRARLNLQLMIPARTGPLPVFLTNQSPHRSPGSTLR